MKKTFSMMLMMCCTAALMLTSCNDDNSGNTMSDSDAKITIDEMQGTYQGVLYAKIDSRDTMKINLTCVVDSVIKLQFPDTLLANTTSNRALQMALNAANDSRELKVKYLMGGWYDSSHTTSFLYFFPESIVKENLLVSDTHHKVTFAFYTGVDSPGLFFRQSGALNFEMTVGGIYYDDKLQSDLNRRLTFYFKGTKLRHSTQDV
ncbi:MAG: hypothetical protein J5971_02080 [Prevotella sp.]|nr:hypothetical protein [Prevotella sp.]